MSYTKLQNTWSGLRSYNLNGKKNTIEKSYDPRYTMSFPEWIEYVKKIGSGSDRGWTGQAVYSGHGKQKTEDKKVHGYPVSTCPCWNIYGLSAPLYCKNFDTLGCKCPSKCPRTY